MGRRAREGGGGCNPIGEKVGAARVGEDRGAPIHRIEINGPNSLSPLSSRPQRKKYQKIYCFLRNAQWNSKPNATEHERKEKNKFNFFLENWGITSIEPFKVEETLQDPGWVLAMQEELNNFKRNEVWSLVPHPKQNVVGTKCVFRNKQDEYGVVTRNKARLVAKGYAQVACLDFEKTFALVARLDSIWILLAYAAHRSFKLFKMDMKSVFLNGSIKEEVYVEQPPGFKDDRYPDHVYKLSN
jgi:hypothetical protein